MLVVVLEYLREVIEPPRLLRQHSKFQFSFQTHQLKETDDAQKHNCELEGQSSDSPWPSIGSLLAQPTASRDAEIQRMKEAERVSHIGLRGMLTQLTRDVLQDRRRREAAEVDPIGQSEMMANFEDTF